MRGLGRGVKEFKDGMDGNGEKKAEDAKKDYEIAVEKASKAKQKTIEMKNNVQKMEGLYIRDGYGK